MVHERIKLTRLEPRETEFRFFALISVLHPYLQSVGSRVER